MQREEETQNFKMQIDARNDVIKEKSGKIEQHKRTISELYKQLSDRKQDKEQIEDLKSQIKQL